MDDKQRCENRMEKLENNKASFKTWTEMVEAYDKKIMQIQK